MATCVSIDKDWWKHLTRVIPPESKGLDKLNFLGKMYEEILNEDK